MQNSISNDSLTEKLVSDSNYNLALKKEPLFSEATIALTCYCFSSISMTILNKLVLSGHKFGMNFLLLMIQSMVCVFFLRLFKAFSLLNYRNLNRKDVQQWFPVSLLLIAMIYTGSLSLQYLTVAMFTVFKNLTIVFIALGERQIFKSSITYLMWLSFMLIIGSSVIGGFNDLTFNLPGYLWMTFNCFVSASYILFMRFTIKKVQFADFDSVYYNNILAIPVLGILSLLVENWSGFIDDYGPNGNLAQSRTALFLGMAASSCAAFAISYSTSWSVRVASSTTYSMVGALNKLPMAISGLLFFPAERKVTNVGNIVSILVAFASGIVYSIAQVRERQKKLASEISNTHSPKKDDTITMKTLKF